MCGRGRLPIVCARRTITRPGMLEPDPPARGLGAVSLRDRAVIDMGITQPRPARRRTSPRPAAGLGPVSATDGSSVVQRSDPPWVVRRPDSGTPLGNANA